MILTARNHDFSVPSKTYDVQSKSSIRRINGIDELLGPKLKHPSTS